MYTQCISLVYIFYWYNNMYFINIHINIQIFTPDYMSQGREIDEHQERETL